MKRKNTKFKIILKIFVFILVFMVLYLYSAMVLAPKSLLATGGSVFYQGKGFYAEKENTIDVFVCGNSDVVYGFSPLELYSEYGITAYSSGVANQTVSGSFELIKSAIELQKPKVVIFETDSIYINKNIVFAETFEKLSVFSIPIIYHSRWKELEAMDFITMPDYEVCVEINKGFIYNDTISGYQSGNYMGDSDSEPKKIKFSVINTLNNLVELCRETNTILIFMEIPSASSWTYAKHNAVEQYASENGVQFIDFNVDLDAIDFNWAEDGKDNGYHLNVYGANKVTSFVGDILKTNYGLESHIGDSKYAEWDDLLINYEENNNRIIQD